MKFIRHAKQQRFVRDISLARENVNFKRNSGLARTLRDAPIEGSTKRQGPANV